MDTEGQPPEGNSQPRPEDVAVIEHALIMIRHDQTRRRLQHRAEWAAEHGLPNAGAGHHGGADPGHEGFDHAAFDHSAFGGGRAGFGPGPGGSGPPGFGGGPGHGHRGRRDSSLGRAARFRLLDALEAAERDGRTLTITLIGEMIGVDQPRASRLVQEASDAGLVRRTTDPSDARRSIVELTAAGRKQISEVRSMRRSAVEDALADFTPQEIRTFADLFDRFVRSWPRD